MSSSIAASLGLTRPRKRTTPQLESGEFVAPPPTSFASPLVIGSVGTKWSTTGSSGKQKDADEESLFELEEYFVDGIRAVGTPRSVQQGGGGEGDGEESEEEYPTIRYVGGITAPNTPKQATSIRMEVERSVTPKASRLMRVQTVKARSGGRKEKDIGTSPLVTVSDLTPDLAALVSEAMGRTASTATIDRPFIGRSISYHPPPSASPDSLIPAASISTSTPLPAPVPPSASSLQVFIPLTMPLNVPRRPSSDPPPPPLPPKSPIRLVQAPQPAAISPLASPSSNPSPLSTPGRGIPAGFIAIPQAAYSQLMSPSNSQNSTTQTLHPPSSNTPLPLSTPGREVPPQTSQVPTLPSTSAEAAQLHATMVAAAVAAATAQIERSQSILSTQTSSTSSSMTVVPTVLQAGGGGGGQTSGIARKPPPTLFALSNAATEQQAHPSNQQLSPEPSNPPIRQLTLPQMMVTTSDPNAQASIVPGYSSLSAEYSQHTAETGEPHREVLSAGPASIPLSRYGTRGAANTPQPVVFTPPQRSNSVNTLNQPQPSNPEPSFPSNSPLTDESHSASVDSHQSSNDLSSSSLSLNRSNSSLALLAPLTKFPDPAFPRRPLVLSEHLSRFRKSSVTPTSPSSLWHEMPDGQLGGPNGEGRTKRKRKVLGTMFRTGKGAAIKWVGKDGLLGEDERWTIQKWGLMFTVASLFGYGLAGMICAFSTYLHSWQGADVAVVAETGLMTASTIAAFVLLLTSLLGLSGTLLNSRPLLAIYAVLLWPCLAVMLVVGYISYRRASLNLEGKLDQLWSQALSAAGRKVIQDEFLCCDDATFTPTCFPRSNLPGCKGSLLRFEMKLLQFIYRTVLGLVPLHLVNITLALLCANHVDRQFGKGLMPRQYRLKANDFSPLLLPTLSRTFPSLPSQHAPSLQRHATHRSTSSVSSFTSTKEEDLILKEERREDEGDRQAWNQSGGIRLVGG
ncbi:hypothetical protein JCM3765_000073 [Sporobolomyces pararoseus]